MSKEDKYPKPDAYKVAFSILIVFALTAIIGGILGKVIDINFNLRPYGTLLGLGVSYGFAWIVVARIIHRYNRGLAQAKKEIKKEATKKSKATKQIKHSPKQKKSTESDIDTNQKL